MRRLFEKNPFEHTYIGIERDNSSRGYSKLVHIMEGEPDTNKYAMSMSFNAFLDYLQQHPVEDLYFFGPATLMYQHNWFFRNYINRRHLEKYFQDMPDEFIENELLRS